MKMIYIVILIIYVISFTYITPAPADDARISDINVILNKDSIIASASLVNGFDKKIEEEINSGIEKDIVYEIVLKKKRSGWYDEDVLSKEVKYTVKYDLLKKQYTVKIQDDGNKEKIVLSYGEVKAIVSRIENVMVAQRKFIEPNEEYYASVRAEMKDKKISFFLDYFLFFIPFSDINTSWAESAPFKVEKKP
ncbi:MAG: DUF4390 domain-containing protein [Nitrospirae bacterium]|nr:DUF4390 domain-containing protein [Nitrospirota bacterium]